jgi:hypothetical protein
MARARKISYHQRIIALLAADGQWHTMEEIHQAVARFIDAEAADNEYRKRHPNWEQDKRPVRVAQGKKRLVFLSLNSAIHHAETVVARGRDWNRKFRLTAAALKVRRAKEVKQPEVQE